jgi:tetratricopeptide (TPR) repeat protein
MGSLCQQKAEGTLVLEQNDGCRRLYWVDGNIIFLQSDVAGEQFGNYLLRQGILDFPALSELLANEERFRLGEKVIQWGLMSIEERDLHLRSLQEQVMIHALEHSIVHMDWKPGKVQLQLSDDLRFQVNHRHFVWSTFQEAHNEDDLCDLLFQETEWRWEAGSDLLGSVGDLPLTPQTAYALSFLGREPMGFETFLSLSNLEEGQAARLLVTLWALGALTLSQGVMPKVVAATPPGPAPAPPPPPPPPPPSNTPMALPPLEFTPRVELEPKLELEDTGPGVVFPAYGEIPTLPVVEMEAPSESPTVRAKKLFNKAKYLLAQDRTVEAIRLLEQSVQLDPDTDQAYEPWLLLGKHRLVNPAWSTRAIEALQAASRLRPKAAEPWALMGEVYHRKGFRANTKACFKKALELDPSVPVPSDINLKEEDVEPAEQGGLFSRFKAILGGNKGRD